MAKGLVLSRDGGGEPAEVLELQHTLKKPSASPGFVVIHLTVRPVNPTDFLKLRGFYGAELLKGTVHGSEGFGIVEEVGEGVTKVKVGQRVTPRLAPDPSISFPGAGSMQEYVEVPESNVYAIPDSVSDEVASQFIVNPWTAFGIVEQLQVQNGEYILQSAAGSILGRELIQLAKYWGYKTINVVRRDELKEELKAIGGDEVINSSTEDVIARVKEITGGKGAYAAVDAVGGEMSKLFAASVRSGGTVLIYGVLSSAEVIINLSDLMRGVEVKAFMLPGYVSTREKRDQVAAQVLRLLEQKVITPLTGKKFAFEDFKEALVEAEKNARGGKVLIVNT